MKNAIEQFHHTVKYVFNVTPVNLTIDSEAVEYNGFQCRVKNKNILYRTSKITPKKIGQFLTCWKRNSAGITEPYTKSDSIDFYVVDCKTKNQHGVFVFPKPVLVEQGILTTKSNDGKRGFRVYPSWDNPTSKQAIQTQHWQLDFFVEMVDEDSYRNLRSLLDK